MQLRGGTVVYSASIVPRLFPADLSICFLFHLFAFFCSIFSTIDLYSRPPGQCRKHSRFPDITTGSKSLPIGTRS